MSAPLVGFMGMDREWYELYKWDCESDVPVEIHPPNVAAEELAHALLARGVHQEHPRDVSSTTAVSCGICARSYKPCEVLVITRVCQYTVKEDLEDRWGDNYDNYNEALDTFDTEHYERGYTFRWIVHGPNTVIDDRYDLDVDHDPTAGTWLLMKVYTCRRCAVRFGYPTGDFGRACCYCG